MMRGVFGAVLRLGLCLLGRRLLLCSRMRRPWFGSPDIDLRVEVKIFEDWILEDLNLDLFLVVRFGAELIMTRLCLYL